MVAGHLREERGFFHIVLSYTDENGKRQTPQKSTGLPVKGNKKRAEAMLLEARKTATEALAAAREQKTEAVNSGANSKTGGGMLFTDFMLKWLEIMKPNLELTTYGGYQTIIKHKINPYFTEHCNVTLNELEPMHIQDYYTHELTENHLSVNTVLRYHANIRKALQLAVKLKLIKHNPANSIERPRPVAYRSKHYDEKQIMHLFLLAKDHWLLFAIVMGAFYGLRRGEIVGLKKDAINFEKKTIAIKHTVTETSVDGKHIIIEKDRPKTKKSFRTLPLVKPVEFFVRGLMEYHEQNRKVCGKSYCTQYLDYLYRDELGHRITPDALTRKFPLFLEEHGLPRIRLHELRHSCANLLYAKKVSLKEIQGWLGHSTIATTANIYLDFDYNNKIDSANSIIGVFGFNQEEAPQTAKAAEIGAFSMVPLAGLEPARELPVRF